MLAVNGRFQRRSMTGVERYAREVSNRLPGNMRLLAPATDMPGLRGQLWEQIVLPRLVSSGETLWSPANSGPLAILRQVVTIHDTLALDHPEWFQPIVVLWNRFFLPRLVCRAHAILTVSEYTRSRLIDLLGIAPERVIHVPAGVDLAHFRPAQIEETTYIRKRYHLPSDYFLSTDTPGGDDSLLNAWETIRKRYPTMRLVIIGDKPGGLSPLLSNDNAPNVHHTGYIREEDLPALYSGAVAFVSPFREEGDGLTALEAMACGTPVVIPHQGAYSEMVGEAGLLVDPDNPTEIASAMEKIITDAGVQADLCLRGLERARQFSWEATARQVASVLRSVER